MLLTRRARCSTAPPRARDPDRRRSCTGTRRRSRIRPYDPRWWHQLDDPVLEQLETAALRSNHDVRSALARLDEARAVFDERSPRSVSEGDRRSVRRRARSGAAGIHRRAGPDQYLSRRARRLVGAGPLRPRACGRCGGVGERRELRGGARQRSSERCRRGGAELLRAARHSAAAVGARAQPGQPARDAASDRRAPRCRHRRGAGRRQRVGARRGDRGRTAAAANRARRARTSARRAHRQGARAAHGGPGPARLPDPGQDHRARAAE